MEIPCTLYRHNIPQVKVFDILLRHELEISKLGSTLIIIVSLVIVITVGV